MHNDALQAGSYDTAKAPGGSSDSGACARSSSRASGRRASGSYAAKHLRKKRRSNYRRRQHGQAILHGDVRYRLTGRLQERGRVRRVARHLLAAAVFDGPACAVIAHARRFLGKARQRLNLRRRRGRIDVARVVVGVGVRLVSAEAHHVEVVRVAAAAPTLHVIAGVEDGRGVLTHHAAYVFFGRVDLAVAVRGGLLHIPRGHELGVVERDARAVLIQQGLTLCVHIVDVGDHLGAVVCPGQIR